MRCIIYDLETSGLDEKEHAIIQFAGMAVEWSTLEVLEELEVKVRFDVSKADPDALAGNSYDESVWAKEAIHPRDAVKKISAFFRSYSDLEKRSRANKPYQVAQLVGHNADRFDNTFLIGWYKRLDEFMPASFSALDTCQWARWFFFQHPHIDPPGDMKLETLSAYFQLKADFHDALADIRVLRLVMIEIDKLIKEHGGMFRDWELRA